MLRPQEPPSVPDDTRRVARSAFPKGTLCLRIADALGPVYRDSQFAALFPRHGQPAAAPGRLALVVVLQFMETSPTARRPTPCGAGSTGNMRWASHSPT